MRLVKLESTCRIKCVFQHVCLLINIRRGKNVIRSALLVSIQIQIINAKLVILVAILVLQEMKIAAQAVLVIIWMEQNVLLKSNAVRESLRGDLSVNNLMFLLILEILTKIKQQTIQQILANT